MKKKTIKKNTPRTTFNVEKASALSVRFMRTIEDRYEIDFDERTLNPCKGEDRVILSEMIAAMCGTIAMSVEKTKGEPLSAIAVAYLIVHHVTTFAKGRIPTAGEVCKWLTWPNMKAEQGKEGEQ